MKLWIDECLSPTLVARANRRGYWATCNRDRNLLGVADETLHELVIDEEAVFVTNDEADFVALYRRVDLHTGLLVLPQTDRREALWPLLPGFPHGFDAKLDCLVLGERVALLYASQSFAAKGHPCHRLEQLAVAHPGTTLM